ncbi:MAG: DEAD/DEAH box helicase family protein [Methylococcales bacterium]|nr:DEAD/DEAH box helicase family protein [Methylococcales bacterium]
MRKQFQYTRLAYQATAVKSIADVFADVRFYPAHRSEMNPVFKLDESINTLEANITRVRDNNKVTTGELVINTSALNLDVLMETGTGKTFTFIETLYKLHQDYGLAKFIILVPSNPIRQGTLKSLESTAAFFAKAYNNQKISVFNYSPRTVNGFIHNANAGISVLVATYQSFNKDKNTINNRGIEASLFSRAKSYMEALAAIRPVLIIDEPHRFEGAKTVEYLAKFNPLFTVRFGATFKSDYKNLIYTLDSVDAFNQRLVKSITVDTVGDAQTDATLCYTTMTGKAGARSAHIAYQKLDGKAASVTVKVKDNVGEKTGIHCLNGYIVENITGKEVLFSNDFALSLGEASSYGLLADDMQRLIIENSIRSHFAREAFLFKRGIKALSLFFIDSVAKYMQEGSKPALVRDWFETIYQAELAAVLAKPDLDVDYRTYLERTVNNIDAVHKGYFARSHSEKSEEEAIKLILEEKEKLLSFDTDLRFIFSMWALQEGWDNPNIFTLCKLAPSTSKITKLQQIGRGLRLAVNQSLERITTENPDFDSVNELVVIVPATEGDFVGAIQNEIAEQGVRKTPRVFDDAVLVAFGVAQNARIANRVLDALESLGVIGLDDVTGAVITIEQADFAARKAEIHNAVAKVQGADADRMLDYLGGCFGVSRVSSRSDKPATEKLTINPSQYAKFKTLWENLNREAVLSYQLDTPTLIENVVTKINEQLEVKPLTLSITTTRHVENTDKTRSSQAVYDATPHSLYSLGEFVRDLANSTKLSYATVAEIIQRMASDKFALIACNENRALAVLKDICLSSIYELIINKIYYKEDEIGVKYKVGEIKVKTSLTDNTGALLDDIHLTQCGKEKYVIREPTVRHNSLFNEDYLSVDSEIEKNTVEESNIDTITVFSKLPKINIPTPRGNYNPDFGYVVKQGDNQYLYLVVETKGYDSHDDVGSPEKLKIESAKQFFKALQNNGVNVRYETKLNNDSLAGIIGAGVQT